MSGLTSGSSKGFTLLEIIVALTIIAIITAIALPRIRYRGTQPLDELAESLNRLTRLAYGRAIMTGTLHRIVFKMSEPREVRLEVQDGAKRTGEPTFTRVMGAMIPSSFLWDKRFEVRNFYIRTVDEARTGTLKDAWFYIVPEGLAQDIIINVEDQETQARRGFVLNPFTVKFALYDTFQKP